VLIEIGDLRIDATPAGGLDRLHDSSCPRGGTGILITTTRKHRGSTLMAELTISADEITEALRRNVDEYTPDVGAEQVGRIVEVGDGIARVSGLPNVAVNELLEFEDGTVGLALNLDEDTIGAVVLGGVDNLDEEQVVRATGEILSVPVGDALLGRVVNASASRSTARGRSKATSPPHGGQAPGIVGRQPVSEPLQTGIKAIDAMTPIGRASAS